MGKYINNNAIQFIRRISDPDLKREKVVTQDNFEDLVKIAKEIIIGWGCKTSFEHDDFNADLLFLEKKKFCLWRTDDIEINKRDIMGNKENDLVYVHLSTSALPLSSYPYWQQEIFEEPRKIFIFLDSVLPLTSKGSVIVLEKNFLVVQTSEDPSEELRRKENTKNHFLSEEEIKEMKKFLIHIKKYQKWRDKLDEEIDKLKKPNYKG